MRLVPGTVKGLNDVGLDQDRNPYAQIGDTIVFSPTLFLDVRYGATRDHTDRLGGDYFGFHRLRRLRHRARYPGALRRSRGGADVTPQAIHIPGAGTFQTLHRMASSPTSRNTRSTIPSTAA